MSKDTERLRNHVASYKHLSAHRQNCLDVCGEVERLTAEGARKDERIATDEVIWQNIYAECKVMREALEKIDGYGSNLNYYRVTARKALGLPTYEGTGSDTSASDNQSTS